MEIRAGREDVLEFLFMYWYKGDFTYSPVAVSRAYQFI
jgi:hypothetical protein